MSDEIRLLEDGPESARYTLVLAHGAGAPMDSPFLVHVSRGLAERDVRVVRFEFPYMERRRERVRRPPDPERVLRERWIAVIERLGGGAGLVIGGKSLGGRIASLVADGAGVRGLVCLGYPFHPPGKPDRLRTAHLAELVTPTLILQGSRDALGSREEIAEYRLAPSIGIEYLEDGDHSFKPRASSGRTLDDNLARAIEVTAAFLERV